MRSRVIKGKRKVRGKLLVQHTYRTPPYRADVCASTPRPAVRAGSTPARIARAAGADAPDGSVAFPSSPSPLVPRRERKWSRRLKRPVCRCVLLDPRSRRRRSLTPLRAAYDGGAQVRYWQCASNAVTGANTWGGLVACGGAQYWVADAGNACGSLSVSGNGWSVVSNCSVNGALAHNASGMCLSCWTDESVAGFCASQDVKGSGALACCVAVVQERLQGATALHSSCRACQQVGLCPESNTRWTSISKDTHLALCRDTGGKVDNDNSGTPVTWCHNDGYGIVAIIIVGCVVVFAAIVGAGCFLCPCCPVARRRRRQQLPATGLYGGPAQLFQQQPMPPQQPYVYGYPQPQVPVVYQVGLQPASASSYYT